MPRTLAESLYLLTAPATAVVGLLLVVGGLGAGAVGLLVPGGSRLTAGGPALARRSADLERWRIGKLLCADAGAENAALRPSPKNTAVASDPGLWFDAAHAVAVLPVVLVTSVVTGRWWFVGVAVATFPLRYTPGSMRPGIISVGSAQSHLCVSLGLLSPGEHVHRPRPPGRARRQQRDRPAAG